MSISFVGLDTKRIFFNVIRWEATSRVAKRILRNSPHEKVRLYGHSYATAFINAVIAASFGAVNAWGLWNASEDAKARVLTDPSEPWYAETQAVSDTAYVFMAWVLYDLAHILADFPKLGGADQVAHHLGFGVLSACSVGFGICPFAGAWLFAGELSSLPLNARWFLIQTGRGAGRAMTWANGAFALLFFLTRVALYWHGLAGFLTETLPALVAGGCPQAVVALFAALVPAGALLNAYWFVLIVRMATGRGGGRKNKPNEKKAA